MSSTASARSGTAAIRASPLCWLPATAMPFRSLPATASRASPSRPSPPASMATRSNRPPGSRCARPASSKSPTRRCASFFAASRPATQPSTKKPSACSAFDLKPLPPSRDLLERPIDIREHLPPHPLVPVHTLEGFLEVLDLHDSERALVAVRRHPMVADRRHLRRRFASHRRHRLSVLRRFSRLGQRPRQRVHRTLQLLASRAVRLVPPDPLVRDSARYAHALQLPAALRADRAGAFRQPRRRRVRSATSAHCLASTPARERQGRRGGQHHRPHCFPPPCTRKAGSIPRSRMTASQIFSTGVSKMRFEEMLALSHPPATISRSSCPGPQPA